MHFLPLAVDMASTLPVIEVVTFGANARCLGDPNLFKEVRDMAAATTKCVQLWLEQTYLTVWQGKCHVLGS
jgi:hypothetical protein